MATKAFDLSKFRKTLTKSIDGLGVGFNDPTDWVSTGNYALNYLISGDFNRGIPLGKVTVFAGESGAGKSYICSGNIIKNAQEQGIFVVLIDSENALDEDWLKALGVDTSESKLLKLSMAMIRLSCQMRVAAFTAQTPEGVCADPRSGLGRWGGCGHGGVLRCNGGLFGTVEPVELVRAQQDEVNHRCQTEQEHALDHHGSQGVVKSPNSPHGFSPR